MVVENVPCAVCHVPSHVPACMCIEIWIFVVISENDGNFETKLVYTGWSDVPARWDPYLGIYRSSKFDYRPLPVQKNDPTFSTVLWWRIQRE